LVVTQLIVKELLAMWNPTVHYRVHKRQPMNSTLSLHNPGHILIPYPYKIPFNINLPADLYT
jgi:hypothetical protein